MMSDKQDAIQLLNTAVIKSKEKRINATYEERLAVICNSPVMNALLVAVDHLSEDQKVSKDHAAVQLIETIRELDSIWNDYVLMEGIGKLKDLLKNNKEFLLILNKSVQWLGLVFTFPSTFCCFFSI